MLVTGVPQVIVVADDLTGANATAALFARLGLRTRTVAATSEHVRPGPDIDVTVVTTGSRRFPPQAAADRVRGVLESFCDMPGSPGDHDSRLLVKRVDTTLRGPIGAELAAMLSWRRSWCRGRVAALAVPAYPAAGRTTVGGIHLLNGVPVARSPAGRDPVTPVRNSRAADLLVAGSTLTTAELHLDDLDAGDEILAEMLESALGSADVTVADATSDADVARLARAASAIRPRMGDIVAVDSGPFGAAYCAALGITERTPRSPVLVVVGSPADPTQRQLRAADRGASVRIHVATERHSAIELAALAISEIDARAAVTGWQVAPPQGQLDHAWADQVPSRLAQAARHVLAARPLAGVFACGGEVAAAVLAELEAQGLDIETEVQPLAVAGRIIGGPWDGLPFVTKGGLVGDDNAIIASIGHLHSMHQAVIGTAEAQETSHS